MTVPNDRLIADVRREIEYIKAERKKLTNDIEYYSILLGPLQTKWNRLGLEQDALEYYLRAKEALGNENHS